MRRFSLATSILASLTYGSLMKNECAVLPHLSSLVMENNVTVTCLSFLIKVVTLVTITSSYSIISSLKTLIGVCFVMREPFSFFSSFSQTLLVWAFQKRDLAVSQTTSPLENAYLSHRRSWSPCSGWSCRNTNLSCSAQSGDHDATIIRLVIRPRP